MPLYSYYVNHRGPCAEETYAHHTHIPRAHTHTHTYACAHMHTHAHTCTHDRRMLWRLARPLEVRLHFAALCPGSKRNAVLRAADLSWLDRVADRCVHASIELLANSISRFVCLHTTVRALSFTITMTVWSETPQRPLCSTSALAIGASNCQLVVSCDEDPSGRRRAILALHPPCAMAPRVSFLLLVVCLV